MVYSFAHIGAALAMKVEDVFTQNRRLSVRLREKGGKAHAMPCHHNLEEYLPIVLPLTRPRTTRLTFTQSLRAISAAAIVFRPLNNTECSCQSCV